MESNQLRKKAAMYKKALIAAAIVLATSPAFVSAQDFFFSFDENSRQFSSTVASGTATGSVFIFRDENLDVNQLDLDFTNDNSSVVSFTGGVVFNDGSPNSGLAASAPGGGDFTSFMLLDPTGATPGVTPTDGRLFATSFLPTPLPPNSNLRPRANGVLLARVDFDVVGPGTANFSFIPGALGIINDGVGQLDVDLTATGSITVEAIPEPSSSILLMLAATAMVARRRRS